MGRVKGAPAPQHTEKEKIALSEKVCELYETQNATIESCCEAIGISDGSFRLWCRQIAEIGERYKKAKELSVELYWDRLRDKAQRGLERLVEGTTYTEIRRENGEGPKGPITKTVEAEVVIMPNPISVIFALKGEFPDRFVERTRSDATVTISNGGELSAEQFEALKKAANVQ